MSESLKRKGDGTRKGNVLPVLVSRCKSHDNDTGIVPRDRGKFRD